MAKDISAHKALDNAKEKVPEENAVVVVGWGRDGRFQIIANKANIDTLVDLLTTALEAVVHNEEAFRKGLEEHRSEILH